MNLSKQKKNTTEPKEQPKYNLFQNTGFMLSVAWKSYKSVIFLGIAVIFLAVLTNLAELFIAPAILQQVEAHASLALLIRVVLIFSGVIVLLAALKDYVETNICYGRIAVRTSIFTLLGRKKALTSLPNVEDNRIIKMFQKAEVACGGNDEPTEAVWQTLTDLLSSVIGFVIYLFLLTNLDPVLMAVVIVTAAVSFFVSNRMMKWEYDHLMERSTLDNRFGYLEYRSTQPKFGKDIRIFGMQGWLNDIYRSTKRLLDDFLHKRESRYLWGDLVDVIMTFLRNGAAYAYLIFMMLKQGMTASEFLLYFTAVGGFAAWVTGILNGITVLHKQSIGLSAVRAVLELPEPFLFEEGRPLVPDSAASYEFTLRNVSFRYPEAEKDTLHRFNLTIHPGEKLAIVGLNGAGKTTLIKLLCGLYDPTEGEVLLNGVNIKEYNRRDYYRMFSTVFQDFTVMSITLAENVAQDYENIDRKKLFEVLDKAGLTEKVQSLPQKELTHLGKEVFEDGVELSGGETQRLMLARALYKDAPVLVLDEPTAALDPINENDIYLKYNEMTKGRTAVYISHRLASTRFCDRILMIADGGIAEEGTHESLMQAGGKYAELFAVQSKYYQKGGIEDEE